MRSLFKGFLIVLFILPLLAIGYSSTSDDSGIIARERSAREKYDSRGYQGRSMDNQRYDSQRRFNQNNPNFYVAPGAGGAAVQQPLYIPQPQSTQQQYYNPYPYGQPQQ